MAYISKPDYSRVKGFQELQIDLSDLTESAMVDWEIVKFVFDEKTGVLYACGKVKSVSSVDSAKLPDWMYITFHTKEYTFKKETKQPSQFELWVHEIAKPAIETGDLLTGKMMLSPGMALNIEMVKQFVNLQKSTSTIELPTIEISGFSGGNSQKSYGMKPEEKITFLAKQLKFEEPEKATLFELALAIDVNYPEQKQTMLELLKVIL